VHREHLGKLAKAYAHSKWSAATQAERMVAFYLALTTNKNDALQANIHTAFMHE
jgi:hypothetical protein